MPEAEAEAGAEERMQIQTDAQVDTQAETGGSAPAPTAQGTAIASVVHDANLVGEELVALVLSSEMDKLAAEGRWDDLDSVVDAVRELGDRSFAVECKAWWLKKGGYGDLARAVEEYNENRDRKEQISYDRARYLAEIWEDNWDSEQNRSKLTDLALPPSMWFIIRRERKAYRAEFRDMIHDLGWNTTVAALMLRVPWDDRRELWEEALKRGWTTGELEDEIEARYPRPSSPRPRFIDLNLPADVIQAIEVHAGGVVRAEIQDRGKYLRIDFSPELAAAIAAEAPIDISSERLEPDQDQDRGQTRAAERERGREREAGRGEGKEGERGEEEGGEDVSHALSDQTRSLKLNLHQLDLQLADAQELEAMGEWEGAADILHDSISFLQAIIDEDIQPLRNALHEKLDRCVENIGGGSGNKN